jgi:hypothetical protein
MTKLGEPQTGGKLAIVTRTPFSLQQKPEPFRMGELLAFAVVSSSLKALAIPVRPISFSLSSVGCASI